MDLSLSIVAYRNAPPAQPGALRLSGRGGSVGRNPDNDLVLPDPFVSGVHARIEYADGGYQLTDLSANGCFLNGSVQPLGRGNRTLLRQGDTLDMGDYRLRVALEQTAPGPDAAAGLTVPVTPGSIPAGASLQVPDDFDLLAQGRPEPWRGTAPDHLPEANYAYTPPAAVPEGWDLLGAPAAAPAPAPAPALGPAAGPGPGTPAPPAPPGAGLEALCRGLGLAPPALSGGEAERVLEQAGELLRVAVAQLLRVLAARAEFKHQLRLDTTALQPRDNNPLKFTTDPGEALSRMLLNREPGFVSGPRALSEALDDLLTHEAALMAGLRAALHGLLQRFDPGQLERQFQSDSRGGLFGGTGRARYWDLYAQVYADVARDAGDGFQELFAREFNQAYSAQVQQLQAARAGPGT
jgi:type VI secretion system protein